MRKTRRKFAKGITLVELLMGVIVSLIVLFTAALLLVSGHKGWASTYKYAYGNIQVNALETMIAFGKTGRMSNKSEYVLYNYDGSTFDGPVLPSDPTNPVEVVTGNAIEFRYWDEDLKDSFMDTDVTGNAFALFYVDDEVLKVDRGKVDMSTGNKLPASSTQILAENVQSLEFSHTTNNAEGDGNGCIKMDLALYDPQEDRGIHVKTATLMRNVWP
ncbi:MAG: hypothetical protein JXA96_05745 [Sedimentisphaerales bacterium]|nr:hypothetical protein [Sedimentisphaerales bacterium]